ncbi:hypothetical protein XU18_2171 [Perkinsela sp. CCAP 1560/4]|nr:hypothetical protein XU18_2171 [Perkinsela sp. CCAP 1560/4]|eukprot:KNH07126.1 hypothetical protein XU18_2171 [Perkinsela sp. CCAP 1560/4]
MALEIGSIESNHWTLRVTGYCRGVVVHIASLEKVADTYREALFRGDIAPSSLDQFYLICLQVDTPRPSSSITCEEVHHKDITLGLSESFADEYCGEIEQKLVESTKSTTQSLFLAIINAMENTQIGDILYFRNIGCLAYDGIWFASRDPVGMLVHKKLLIELLCTNPGKEQGVLLFTKYFTQWQRLLTAIRESFQSEEIRPTEGQLLLEVLQLLDVFLHSLRAASHEQILNGIISQLKRIQLRAKIHSSWANEAFQLLDTLIERYQNHRSKRFHFYPTTIPKVRKEENKLCYLQEVVMKAQKNQKKDGFPFDIIGVNDEGVLVIRYSHSSDESTFGCAIAQNRNESDWKIFWFRSLARSNDLMYLDGPDFGEFIALLQAVIVSIILRNAQKYKKNDEGTEIVSEYDFCCFELEDRQLLMSLSDINAQYKSEPTSGWTNTLERLDTEGRSCEISVRDSSFFKSLQSEESKLHSIEDIASTLLVRNEKTWIHLVGDLGNRSTSMAVRLLQTAHQQRRLSTSDNMSAFVEAFQRARMTQKNILEKISTDDSAQSLDACSATLKNLYNEVLGHLETFGTKRSNLSVLIISDSESKLEDYANICTKRNLLNMPISRNFEPGEGRNDRLVDLRAKLWRLLIEVERSIWECSCNLDELDAHEQGPDQLYSFPVDSYISCFNTTSLPDDDRPITQDVLDEWLNCTPSCANTKQKVTREAPLALFRIPPRPTTSPNPPPAFPSKSATKAERKLFVKQCLIYHSHCLQLSYFTIIDALQDIKTVEGALCLRWKGMDAITSKAIYFTSFADLHKPQVRWIISRQDPSLVLVDCERENTVSKLLEALFTCTNINPKRCSIMTVSVEKSLSHPYDLCIQYQEKHPVSQGVMKFRQACAPLNSSESMLYEHIVEKSGTGIEEDAFIWTTPASDESILMEMLFKLAAYLYSAKPTWKTKIVVSDDLMKSPLLNAIKNFTEARSGLALCGISAYKSTLSDAHIVVLTKDDSCDVRDILRFVQNTKYAFYAITSTAFYRRLFQPKAVQLDFLLGGPVLHMRCAKGHNSARRHAFVDFRRENEGSHGYTPHLDFPEYGKWCPMICLRSFKECSSPDSHLCTKKCIECADDHSQCEYPCQRIFDCGHACPKKCREKCDVCEERVIVECDCPGSWVVAGCNMDTQKLKYEKVSHYREVMCSQLRSTNSRACSNTVSRPCSSCAEFTDVPCGAGDPKTCARCDTISPNVRLLVLKRNCLRTLKMALMLEIRSHKVSDPVDSDVCRCPEWEKAMRWKSQQKELSEDYESRQNLRVNKQVENRTHLISCINWAKDTMVRSSQVIETYLDLAFPEKCEDIELHGL